MKKQLRDEWVKALRSGEYAQGKGTLQFGSSFCCMGVLCEVAEKIGFVEAERGFGDNPLRLTGNYLTRQPVASQLRDGDDDKLAGMNDDGEPFPIIADWIENNIPVTP